MEESALETPTPNMFDKAQAQVHARGGWYDKNDMPILSYKITQHSQFFFFAVNFIRKRYLETRNCVKFGTATTSLKFRQWKSFFYCNCGLIFSSAIDLQADENGQLHEVCPLSALPELHAVLCGGSSSSQCWNPGAQKQNV